MVRALARLPSTEANVGMASMMTHHQHAYVIARDSIKEMVGKPGEIHSAQVAGLLPMRLGCLRHGHEMRLDLGVELASQLSASYFLVVAHDPGDIDRDPGVKSQTHHLRRLRMNVSSSSKEIARSG